MNNNDIVPGFDAESENPHWREWHDVSLNHPSIRLVKITKVKGCLILRLEGLLHERSSDYFAERVRRAISAGYNRLIVNCEKLDDNSNMYWYSTKMIFGKDVSTILVKLSDKWRQEIRESLFGIEFNFMASKEEAINYLFKKEKEECELLVVDTLPCTIVCPGCKAKLHTTKHGLYQCSICREMLRVSIR